MPHNTPNPLPTQPSLVPILLLLLLVRRQLRIRNNLQRKPRAEQPHSRHLPIRMIPRHDGALMSERRRDRQRHDGLQQSLRQEPREQLPEPEVGVLAIGSFVARVIFTAPEGARGEAVECTGRPGGDAGKDETFGPGGASGDAGEGAGAWGGEKVPADGGVPGIQSDACGPCVWC